MTPFIREKFEVEEPGKVRVHRQDGSAGPGLPTSGPLYLVGLPGSGKSELGQRLAEKLGVPFLALPAQGGPQAWGQALDEALAQGAPVVEVPHKLMADEGFRQRLASTGRVLYLMANAGVLADRLAKARQGQDPEALRQGLVNLIGTFEPLFMQTLHMLVPAEGPLGEVEALALERLRFTQR